MLNNGIAVGIVTFSDELVLKTEGGRGGLAGEDLVSKLIIETFTNLYSQIPAFKGKESKTFARKNAEHILGQMYIAAALPRLRNQQKEYKKKGGKLMPNSKDWHIEKVIQEFKKNQKQSLSYGEIMLFDDTYENVVAAWEKGVHAFCVPPQSAFTSSCWEAALKVLKSPGSKT